MTRQEQATLTCITIGLSLGLSVNKVTDFLQRYEPSAPFRLLGEGGERFARAWLMDSVNIHSADDALDMARRAAITGFIAALLMGMNLPQPKLENWVGSLLHAARCTENTDPIAVVRDWYFEMIDDAVSGFVFFASDHPCSAVIESAAKSLKTSTLTELMANASALVNQAAFAPRAAMHALNATAFLIESMSIFLQIQNLQSRENIVDQILSVGRNTRSAVQEIAKAAVAWHLGKLQLPEAQEPTPLHVLQSEQSDLCEDLASMFCEVVHSHKSSRQIGIASGW